MYFIHTRANLFFVIAFFLDTISSEYITTPISSVDCNESPPRPKNILLISQSNETTPPYRNGSVITYKCVVGHLIPSNASRECYNGGWLGDLPQCVVEWCPLPIVEGGKWEIFRVPKLSMFRAHLMEGTVIKVSCKTGFNLVGESTRRCLSGGAWSGPKSMCTPVIPVDRPVCPFPVVAHGRFECLTEACDRLAVGVEGSVTCDEGYRLRGAEQVYCLWQDVRPLTEKASWSPDIPRCVPVNEDEEEATNEATNDPLLGGVSSVTIVLLATTSVLGSAFVLLATVLVWRCVRRRYRRAPSGAEDGDLAPPGAHHHVSGGGHTRLHPTCMLSAGAPHLASSDDRVALINPPSYEEAMAQGSCPGGRSARAVHGLSNRLYSGAEDLTEDWSSGCGDQRRSSRSGSRHGPHRDRRHQHGHNQEMDSVSRHSTQTSGSHGAALSGSVETMAVSDGTSVTLRTYESHGSNPSLGSTRPQTGSLGEPAGQGGHCPGPGPISGPPVHSISSHGPVGQLKDPDTASTRS